jgi:hypothetical protein
MHAAGGLPSDYLNGRGAWGSYWSNAQLGLVSGTYLMFYDNSCTMVNSYKSYGNSIRCIREVPFNPTTVTVTGMSTGTMCYNADQTITVAGNGNIFNVPNGSNVTMIAGQNILYQPNTIVQSGGFMWGYIAPTGPFCNTPSMPAVVSGETEIPTYSEQSSFKIYPNPTTGNFILELNGEIRSAKVTVDVFGIYGEKLLTKILNGERKHEFSLSDKPVGVYFIRVITGGKSETAKLSKQ